MRMLVGEEAPDAGTRTLGHNVVPEYFAQDEATRLDPALTVYETLEAGSATDMVPAIRNILGGFLFSGDDIYKKAAVLSGGERTRLAVARMLLRPSNVLLLDEPTNHLDLDSKDVLLEALEDYGGTLILVSHDRYFVERLATKIVEVGHGGAQVYPGTYTEFLWSKANHAALPHPPRPQPVKPPASRGPARPPEARTHAPRQPRRRPPRRIVKRASRSRPNAARNSALPSRLQKRHRRAGEPHRRARARSEDAGGHHGRRRASSTIPLASKPVIDRHQRLMWEVGDLMSQWEALQEHAAEEPATET